MNPISQPKLELYDTFLMSEIIWAIKESLDVNGNETYIYGLTPLSD